MAERFTPVAPLTVFPITDRGLALARRLEKKYRDVVIHRPAALKDGRLKHEVKAAFKGSRALLFISASGIAVRAIAPLLKGKHLDPAIVLMDEKGRFAVSLLSGHMGGANRLTKELASFFNATPVITTATDISNLPSIEDVCEKFALKIENPEAIKRINSEILKGNKAVIVDRYLGRRWRIKAAYGRHYILRASFPKDTRKAVAIISDKLLRPADRRRALVLRPREFVVGIGCKKGVGEKEIEAGIRKMMEGAGVSLLSIRNLATIDIKRHEKGLLDYAKKAGLPIDFYSAGELNKIKPPSGVSRFVKENTGAAGVCENAALLSSGGKRLWRRKKRLGKITIALARAGYTS
ncbi:MAG: cobalamin biosynthesis protein [Deltaproteobacteria bacterium]|nr:cobalamin biosynthesis protein [Deltaproteobacteria bacterium]